MFAKGHKIIIAIVTVLIVNVCLANILGSKGHTAARLKRALAREGDLTPEELADALKTACQSHGHQTVAFCKAIRYHGLAFAQAYINIGPNHGKQICQQSGLCNTNL
ncbi:hypothetical protein Ddc_08400 [Ditylenchus destructor]|nr:hypothetical protein Ddc_08400 [Ditylenchus destructor]